MILLARCGTQVTRNWLLLDGLIDSRFASLVNLSLILGSGHDLEYRDEVSGLVEAGDTTEEIAAIMDEVTHATLGTAR